MWALRTALRRSANRMVLGLLAAIPMRKVESRVASVQKFGHFDMHLPCSLIDSIPLWTLDNRLSEITKKLSPSTIK